MKPNPRGVYGFETESTRQGLEPPVAHIKREQGIAHPQLTQSDGWLALAHKTTTQAGLAKVGLPCAGAHKSHCSAGLHQEGSHRSRRTRYDLPYSAISHSGASITCTRPQVFVNISRTYIEFSFPHDRSHETTDVHQRDSHRSIVHMV